MTDESTVVTVTVADLHARRAQILAEFPHLADWAPTCTRCSSPYCNVSMDGLTRGECRAVVELDTIRRMLGED